MKKKLTMATTENDFRIDLTFHSISASLIEDFTQEIVKPYYNGNLNAAFQDLIQKALAENHFVLSHITHIRPTAETKTIDQDN